MPSLPTPGGSDVWGASLNAAIESLHLGPDAHTNRPTTGLVAGTLYSCTDHSLIYRWTGSAWATFATLAGGSPPGLFKGTWSTGTDTVVLTHDFADGTIPAVYTQDGVTAVENFTTINSGTIPSAPAKMLHLGPTANGVANSITATKSALGVTADKVRYWVAADAPGGAAESQFVADGIVRHTDLSTFAWKQYTEDLTSVSTFMLRYTPQYPTGGPGGYVTRIEYIEVVGTDFAVNDVVLHSGALYMCVVGSTTETPGAGSDWMRITDAMA